MFRKVLLTVLMLLGIFGLVGETAFAASADGEKILVAYFSRADENYGVGYVTKGNTRIVAEMIAAKTGGDLFEIRKNVPYPAGYEDCKTVASREKATNARPSLTSMVENMADYDVIFIGYPIWYGDAPMPVYTFLEGYDFSGKKIIPFCTHGGSGLSGTEQRIMLISPKATLLPGFAIDGRTAQNQSGQTDEKVTAWLKRIGMINS